jgi:hypothetical protein
MTSQRRIDANRRNALLSTGPRTLQGKDAVRFNGLKHGLTARHAVLPGEDPAAFEETVRAFEDHLQPDGLGEFALVHRIADCWWRLRRLRQRETDYYQLRADALQQYSPRFRTLPPHLRPTFVACCDPQGSRALNNLSLLEMRIENALYRALHELERRQTLRTPAIAEINIELKKQTQPDALPVIDLDLKNQTQSTSSPSQHPQPERARPPET